MISDKKPTDIHAQHSAKRKAEYFVEHEKQFQLGFLPTEQSHPKTADFSETIIKDIAAGIKMLQSVDRDIASMAQKVFSSSEFVSLIDAMTGVLTSGGRVFFSGCGATGRLSIQLEAMWRQFWQEAKSKNNFEKDLLQIENSVFSIMTGGDRALIRSVENFEDFISFGKYQASEHNINSTDILIAISEGGETSSVIGTALYALEAGAAVFFIYNNPSEVLCEHIERSRSLIQNPNVTCLDLSTGPMAIAGSTRMQATTSELLVTGVAMELTLCRILQSNFDETQLNSMGIQAKKAHGYVAVFQSLLDELSSDNSIKILAAWTQFEQQVYENNGVVTYFSHDYLLDIFTDTTERAPTFMLPPFRKSNDAVSPKSWIFVKNPLLTTEDTWKKVYRRQLHGLQWDRGTYEKLGATANICQTPPQLDNAEILRYQIGCEDDPSRYEASDSAAILILVGNESVQAENIWKAFEPISLKFNKRVLVSLGAGKITLPKGYSYFEFNSDICESPINLWKHLKLKLILNTVSTSTMARMGRVEGNWMVYAETTNKKLIDRSTRLISHLTRISYKDACVELFRTLESIASNSAKDRLPVPPTIATIRRIQQLQQIPVVPNNSA